MSSYRITDVCVECDVGAVELPDAPDKCYTQHCAAYVAEMGADDLRIDGL